MESQTQKLSVWKRFRWLWYSLITILVVIIILIAITPTVLSHGLLLKIINGRIAGKFEAEKISLNWFSSQEIHALTLEDTQHNQVLEVNSILIDSSLVRLIFSRPNIGNSQVHKPILNLVTYADGSNNLMKALQSKEPTKEEPPKPTSEKKEKEETPFSFPFLGSFQLTEGTITFISPQTPEVRFTHINTMIDAKDFHNPISLKFSSQTEQKQQKGAIDLSLDTNVFAPEGEISKEGFLSSLDQSDFISMNGKIQQLPISGIDQCLSLALPQFQGILLSAFGYQLDATLYFLSKSDTFDVDITMKAPLFTANLKGHGEERLFQLQDKGQIHWEITPEFVQTFSKGIDKDAVVSLKKKTSANVNIERLSFPLMAKQDLVKDLNTHILLSIDPVEFAGSSPWDALSLKTFKASVDTLNLSKTLSAHLLQEGYYNKQPFDMGLDLQIMHFLDAKGKLNYDLLEDTLSCVINRFPLEIIPIDREASKQITDLLGPNLNMNLQAKGSAKFTDLDVSLKTSRLTLEKTSFIIKDFKTCTLTRSSYLALDLTPESVQSSLPEDMHLKSPAKIATQITRLVFPLPSKQTYPMDQIAINSLVQATPINFTMGSRVPDLELNTTRLSIDADSLQSLNAELKSAITLTPQTDPLVQLLGSPMQFSLTADKLDLAHFKNEDSSIQLKLLSEQFQLTSAMQLDRLDYLNINSLQISQLLIAPELVQQLVPEIQPLTLAKPANISFNFEPMKLPLQTSQAKQVNLEASITSPAIAFLNKKTEATSSLENVKMHLNVNAKKNEANFDFSSLAKGSPSTQAGKMDMELVLSNFLINNRIDIDPANLEGSVKMQSIPESFLAPFAIHSQQVPDIFGSHFDIDAEVDLSNLSPVSGWTSLDVSSQLLNLSAALQLEEYLTLKRSPIKISWILTNEALAFLQSTLKKTDSPQVDLEENATFTAKISSLKYPLFIKDPQPEDYHIEAQTSLDKFVVKNKESVTAIEDIEANIDVPRLSDKISLNIEAKTRGNHANGKLRIASKAYDLFTPTHTFNTQTLTGDGDIYCIDVDNAAIENLFIAFTDSPPPLQEFLGSLTSMSGNYHIEKGRGPINFQVNASSLKSKGAFQYDQGALKLNENLTAELIISEKLSKSLLKNANPIFITAVGSENPVTFEAQKEGFFFPVAPYLPKDIQLQKATLNLGKLKMKNGGVLGGIIFFLKFGDLKSLDEMTVWFTPLDMHIKDGVAKYERMDFLIANQIHAATWGTINLVTEEVDMVLAIAASSLFKAFGLNLGEGSMLQIPMHGKLDDVKVDWGSAMTQIGSLIAKDKGGKVFGKILNIASDIIYHGKPIPPPKKPFPWEKEGIDPDKERKASSSSDTSQQNQPSEKKEDEESNDISDMFDSFFGK